jgi:hypothetical protein
VKRRQFYRCFFTCETKRASHINHSSLSTTKEMRRYKQNIRTRSIQQQPIDSDHLSHRLSLPPVSDSSPFHSLSPLDLIFPSMWLFCVDRIFPSDDVTNHRDQVSRHPTMNLHRLHLRHHLEHHQLDTIL